MSLCTQTDTNHAAVSQSQPVGAPGYIPNSGQQHHDWDDVVMGDINEGITTRRGTVLPNTKTSDIVITTPPPPRVSAPASSSKPSTTGKPRSKASCTPKSARRRKAGSASDDDFTICVRSKRLKARVQAVPERHNPPRMCSSPVVQNGRQPATGASTQPDG